MSSPIFTFQKKPQVALQEGEVLFCEVESARDGEIFLAKIDGSIPSEEGEFFFKGRDLMTFSRKETLMYLRSTAFLTPGGDLVGNFTVWENLLLPFDVRSKVQRDVLFQTIGQLFCEDPFVSLDKKRFLNSLPYELDLLGRARAAVLRECLGNPSLVVRTDEPPGLEAWERNEYCRLLVWMRQRFPQVPWMFICGSSELPAGFSPDKILSGIQSKP